MPRVCAASAPSSLLFRNKDAALGRACGRSFHRRDIRGPDFVIVMNVIGKDSAFHQRIQRVAKQEIRNGTQPISSCRMAGDIDAECAQLLDQPPNFRSRAADLLRDLGPTDHDRRMMHQQPHDSPQPCIGLSMPMWRGRPRRRISPAAS